MSRWMIPFTMLLATASASHGAVVWQADFEGLAAGSPVTTSATGNDNTLYLAENYDATVVAGSAFGAGSGNQLKLTGHLGNGNYFVKAGQINADKFYAGGVMVVSFDIKFSSTNNSNITFKLGAFRNGGESASVFTSSTLNTSSFSGNAARVTLVLNLSDSDIALPASTLGSAGVLAANKMTAYYKTSTGAYGFVGTGGLAEVVSIAALTGSNYYSGFAIRPGLDTPNSGQTLLLDNMVITDSVSDAFGGVNVLQLSPGALIQVPEASTLGILGLATGLFVLGRRAL